MENERGRFQPNWLSAEQAVIEPGVSAKPLVTQRAIICFTKGTYDLLLDAFDLQEGEEGPSLPGALTGKLGGDAAIYQAFFGAPAAGMLMEALIASGVEHIVMVGQAGSISPDCRIGDLFLPTWGIREEGTSYHYLPPDALCEISEDALNRIRGYFAGLRLLEGGVWTIDAPYRETADKVQEYARRGVLAVEMECTALMAIATVRQVEFAAVMVITDELFGEAWTHAFGSEQVHESTGRICQAIVQGFRREKA